MQGVRMVEIRICDGCGKKFPMYDGHVYRDVYKNKQRVFCSWSCFLHREVYVDGRKGIKKDAEELRDGSTKYDNPYVVCPFYKGEKKSEIFCEGLFKNSKLHFAMSPSSKKARFRRAYCERDYERCPIARMHFRINRGEEGDCGKV